MLIQQIAQFLISVVTGFFSGICLLRFYMHVLRIPLGGRFPNPLGRVILSLSNWLVLPLRRLQGNHLRQDWASLLAAFLCQVINVLLLMLVIGGKVQISAWLLVVMLVGLANVALSWLTVILVAYTLLSWVSPTHIMFNVLDRLINPFLNPIRKAIPMMGTVDLSPIILFLIFQVLSMVLSRAV